MFCPSIFQAASRPGLAPWVVALGLACAGCHEAEPPRTRAERPTVIVTRPVVGKVVDYAYFTGRTEACESVQVQSRVTGYLTAIDFVPGAEVKANQRLFLIDPRPYQAALDRADGQVGLAEARLKLAKADYARAVEIAKTPGAISQQDVDKYAAAKDEATAAVAAAEANRESARLNVEFTNVLSPVDGVVGRNLLTLGNLVRQDDTLLTTVVSQDPMYAYFDIDEYAMLRVMRLIEDGQITQSDERNGLPVEMGLADEAESYPHMGQIDFVDNRMDSTTGTRQVRGTFANPAIGIKNLRLLTPGLFVRIRLPIGPAYDALLVPESVICTDQGNKYVLIVGKDDVVEYRPITLGPRQPDAMQAVIPVKMIRTKDGLRRAEGQDVSDGKTFDSLTSDDRVIVDGLQRVKPGVQVKVKEREELGIRD